MRWMLLFLGGALLGVVTFAEARGQTFVRRRFEKPTQKELEAHPERFYYDGVSGGRVLAYLYPLEEVRGQDEFTGTLNQARVARGLSPVAFAPSAVPISRRNNACQRSSGLGHFYTGGLAQCAAIGCGDAQSALQMWAASPAHAAIIFNPQLISVGFSCDGWAASVACQMGGGPAPAQQPIYFQPRRRLFRRW